MEISRDNRSYTMKEKMTMPNQEKKQFKLNSLKLH